MDYVDLRLQPLYSLKAFLLEVNINNSSSEFKKFINSSSIISALAGFSEDLLAEGNEIRMSSDLISNLIGEFESLEKEVLNSDIEFEIKKLISDQIIEITSALKNYKFYGTKYLRIVVDSNIGSLATNKRKIVQKVGNHPVFNKYFLRLLGLANVIAKPVVFAMAGLGFANDMENYILPKYEQYQTNIEILENLDFEESGIEGAISLFQEKIEESEIKLLPESSIETLPENKIEASDIEN
ncbi:hypothetical protein IQ254_17280 [Nodosilinea sp. LEGE 07088]|uniref:hypothetical protein n=1 Tax=Nodosilinea sp. LEGE 07088 TaxID=2777968 RepID=UPI00187F1458|nr:hypothetical protein [Nodosilinea sp. LEGE 07088]MBE9138924.1 hypothetical protein [Nodosilinea sp. LEGE 07088]